MCGLDLRRTTRQRKKQHGILPSILMSVDPRTFISSLHGRQRRRERGLDRRDLEAAVSHGTREYQPECTRRGRRTPPRWKFTYEDVVYVTELDMVTEVTSYSVPLPLIEVPVDAGLKRQCKEMKRRIVEGSARVTSHMVIVVDQSGSMKEADMAGHRNRSSCVFYNLAMEVVAAALSRSMVSFTDVVTVIQMRKTATILIDAEPQSWLLFNRLVRLHHEAEADADAKIKQTGGRRVRGPGNFIPALRLATKVLQRTEQQFGSSIALYAFFLSDGRPSDHNYLHVNSTQQVPFILDQVRALVGSLSARVRPRLTFGAFGFAGNKSVKDGDFHVLQRAAQVVTQLGATGVFQRGCDPKALRRALVDMSTLLTRTTSLLSSLAHGVVAGQNSAEKSPRRTDLVQSGLDENLGRGVEAAKDFGDFRVHRVGVQRYEFKKKNTPESEIVFKYFVKAPLQHENATCFAKRTTFLDEGAERVSFEMRECAPNAKGDGLIAVEPPMVWKESVKHKSTQIEWHKVFYVTQREAGRLARKFKEAVDRLRVPADVPRIDFVKPSIYTYRDGQGTKVGGLCEEFLPGFKKWTDNKGGVYNLRQDHAAVNRMVQHVDDADEVEQMADALASLSLDSTNAVPVRTRGTRNCNPPDAVSLRQTIIAHDMLLTFSHWSYIYTKRERLVCDLQGTEIVQEGRPVFQLTDPSIHSQKPGKFGATDHGRSGQRAFLATHECTPLCKLLGIFRK